MHHDEVKAQAAGMPSVFGHGMFSAGLLASALTDYVGEGALTRYAVRFTKQSFPGNVLNTKITVTDVRPRDGYSEGRPVVRPGHRRGRHDHQW